MRDKASPFFTHSCTLYFYFYFYVSEFFIFMYQITKTFQFYNIKIVASVAKECLRHKEINKLEELISVS